MTKRERAVAVAKDALKWISRADVACGKYLHACGIRLDLNKDLGVQSAKVIKECSMCWKGAALVAKARVFDEVSVASMSSENCLGPGLFVDATGGYVTAMLRSVFDAKTLDYAEAAFEQTTDLADVRYDDELKRAVEFGQRFDDNTDRARAVFKEIVRQGGVFRPGAALARLNRAGENSKAKSKGG